MTGSRGRTGQRLCTCRHVDRMEDGGRGSGEVSALHPALAPSLPRRTFQPHPPLGQVSTAGRDGFRLEEYASRNVMFVLL